MTAETLLQLLLTLAAAMVGVGVFGAMSQQSIVMVMMGLELVVNGVLLAGACAWYFLAPAPDAQMLVVLALVVMAVEMVMGFAATIAIYRARGVDMVDMATELSG